MASTEQSSGRPAPGRLVLAGAAALVLGVAAAVMVTANHHHHPRPAAAPLSPFLPSATEQALPTTAVSTTIVAPPTLAPAVIATTTRPTTTTSTTPPVSLPPIQPGWVSVANIHGVGPAQSAVFHLASHDTKLRWVNSGPNFLVYVVDATKGLDATAGYADAECSGPCATDAMALVEPPADYYLLVRSTGGSWAVAIEQYPGTAR